MQLLKWSKLKENCGALRTPRYYDLFCYNYDVTFIAIFLFIYDKYLTSGSIPHSSRKSAIGVFFETPRVSATLVTYIRKVTFNIALISDSL